MILKTINILILITIVAFNISLKFSPTIWANEQQHEVLDKIQAQIEEKKKVISDLNNRINEADGVLKKALETRLNKAWLGLMEENLVFAENVKTLEESGADVSRYHKQVREVLNTQHEIAYMVIKRIHAQLKPAEADMSAADKAVALTKMFDLMKSVIRSYELVDQSIEISKQFKIDVTEQEDLLKKNIAESAATGSIFLEMATQDVIAFSASVSAVPDDNESKAKLTVSKNIVQGLAGILDSLLVIMTSLGMDTSVYQAQVLSATGQITTDLFDFGVVANLLRGWWQSLLDEILEKGPDLIFKLLVLIIIIYVFRKIANLIQRIIEKQLSKSHLQFSELLRRMMVSTVRNIIIVLGILIALSQVGISLGPLLAGLGVVGFIVGFALQDSLSNFAAGMMILIYSPFDVGDLIEAGGISGKVSHMSLVNTTILTLDNQTILIPNNKIWGDVIKNVTAQTMRRVDMMFGISYSDDISKTERVLKELIDSHEKILTDPEPIVRLHELGDSSVNFVVRPWVKRDDYWEVYWDITRSVKMRFDEEGISIPFPQRDVHVYNESTL